MAKVITTHSNMAMQTAKAKASSAWTCAAKVTLWATSAVTALTTITSRWNNKRSNTPTPMRRHKLATKCLIQYQAKCRTKCLMALPQCHTVDYHLGANRLNADLISIDLIPSVS